MKIELVKLIDKKYHSVLDKYGVNTHLRRVHFWSQIQHESGCKAIAENLNYSAEGLVKTFPKYFNVGLSKAYARKPEKIANLVYANRMGNGDEKSGDGWKYRGKGFIQITGKDNYKQLSKDTGIDFINNPDLLLEEPNALISALWFWNKKGLNVFSDKDDVVSITKLINGGLNGIEDRKENVKNLKEML
jgi:putative chitinase